MVNFTHKKLLPQTNSIIIGSLKELKCLFVAYFMRFILQLLLLFSRSQMDFPWERGRIRKLGNMEWPRVQEDFKIIILLTIKLWPDNRFSDTPVHFGSAKFQPLKSSFKFIPTCIPPPQRHE